MPSDIPAFLPRERFDDLIATLAASGRRVIGPTVDQNAIVYAEIDSSGDLPVGVRDRQAPGSYRLHHEDDDRMFAYAVGPTAWKRFVFPPQRVRMFATAHDGKQRFRSSNGAGDSAGDSADGFAFVGVRACDLAALGVQDRVFRRGPFTDDHYDSARSRAFVVAVECTHAASTCFCTSMDTGPEVRAGFDLRMRELDDGFIVDAGTDAGSEILASLRLEPAAAADVEAATTAVASTRQNVEANVGLSPARAATLRTRPEHPRWEEVAQRCLACTNCTIVCPTCFCAKDVIVSELSPANVSVERQWDSCFTLEFGEVSGGNFRSRVRDRYRQWLTHKFDTWWDQFGTTGCIGCGRCIVWCPVGIDVRDEVAAIVGDVDPDPGHTAAIAGTDVAGTDLQVGAPMGSGPAEPAPTPATVLDVRSETADTATIAIADPDGIAPAPGEFVMVALAGIGAPPISVSRSYEHVFELTVRAVGPATAAICNLSPGDEVGIAGPYGRGWPVRTAEGRDIVIVGGGIGLAPLRPVIDHVLAHRSRFGRVHVLIGARTPQDTPFRTEISNWELRADVDCARIVDRAGPDWLGPIGVVTQLMDARELDGARTSAFVCGPERMMQATVETLIGRGVDPEDIHLTTERHMECGVGLCGHCQLGPFLVCRDGPVFTAARLAPFLGVEGI